MTWWQLCTKECGTQGITTLTLCSDLGLSAKAASTATRYEGTVDFNKRDGGTGILWNSSSQKRVFEPELIQLRQRPQLRWNCPLDVRLTDAKILKIGQSTHFGRQRSRDITIPIKQSLDQS